MSNIDCVRLDEGEVNVRILAKETKTDFRRVEAASLKMTARFTSGVGKRYYARLFNTLQLNAHFVSEIARTKLSGAEVGQVEAALETSINTVAERLNQAIDDIEAIFNAHGITKAATHDTVPLEVEVAVISPHGRRYLDVLIKMDQLMPLLQTLRILGIISFDEMDAQRAKIKREVRNVANGARNLAAGLRRRMNAMDLAARAPAETHATSAADRTEQSREAPPATLEVAGSIEPTMVAELDPS